MTTETFLRAILADRHRADPYLAYGDYLMENGQQWLGEAIVKLTLEPRDPLQFWQEAAEQLQAIPFDIYDFNLWSRYPAQTRRNWWAGPIGRDIFFSDLAHKAPNGLTRALTIEGFLPAISLLLAGIYRRARNGILLCEPLRKLDLDSVATRVIGEIAECSRQFLFLVSFEEIMKAWKERWKELERLTLPKTTLRNLFTLTDYEIIPEFLIYWLANSSNRCIEDIKAVINRLYAYAGLPIPFITPA